MSLTIEAARAMVGDCVVYRSHPTGPSEQGVITSVNDRWVFVRYGANPGSQATDPFDLDPLCPTGDPS